jgi:hypothetical protein
MLGERLRMVAALLADDLREAIAHRVELRAAVGDDAVAAFEAERDRGVDQLEEIAVLGRLLGEPRHQLEDLLAAFGLVVEHREQAVPAQTPEPPHGVSAAASSIIVQST